MSEPSKIIDILVVVDAVTLIEKFKDHLSPYPNKPTFIGTDTNLIYMFVKRDEVVGGLATSDLNVKVNPEDVIRWRAISLTLNTQYSVVLTSSEITQGKDDISDPQAYNTSVYVPVPTVDPHTHQITGVTKQTTSNFYFSSNAQYHGNVTYTFSFAVTHNDGSLLGYFKWDPHLSVSF